MKEINSDNHTMDAMRYYIDGILLKEPPMFGCDFSNSDSKTIILEIESQLLNKQVITEDADFEIIEPKRLP